MSMVQKLAAPPLGLHRSTIDQYIAAYDAGAFGADESRTELLVGYVTHLSPVTDPHAACLRILGNVLIQDANRKFIVSCGQPVKLISQGSMPQPDLAVLRYRRDMYSTATPTENDILLIGEVSYSTLDTDRGFKGDLYAAAGLFEYWIFNLVDRCIEVNTQPTPADGYEQTVIYRESDTVDHALLGPRRVEDLLPMTVPAQ